jgi:ABC-type phosphate transport system permease subunit
MARDERYAPIAGVVAVVLWVAGAFPLEKDDRPDGKDTAAFVAWVEENDSSILAGAIIFGFGVLFFLWLLGSLHASLGGAVLFSIPMLTATALAVIRFRALPRWLAWFSLFVALIMAIPTLGFFGVVVGLPLWTLLVSVLLYRSTSRPVPGQ